MLSFSMSAFLASTYVFCLVKYQAVLYSISDVHRLAPSEVSGYEDGIIVEILGMQIYNNVD